MTDHNDSQHCEHSSVDLEKLRALGGFEDGALSQAPAFLPETLEGDFGILVFDWRNEKTDLDSFFLQYFKSIARKSRFSFFSNRKALGWLKSIKEQTAHEKSASSFEVTVPANRFSASLFHTLQTNSPKAHISGGDCFLGDKPAVNLFLQTFKQNPKRNWALLSLNPFYSHSLFGNFLRQLRKDIHPLEFKKRIRILPPFCQHFSYQKLLFKTIQEKLGELPKEAPTALIFTTLALPESQKQFDPYYEQFRKSTHSVFELIEETHQASLTSERAVFTHPDSWSVTLPTLHATLNSLGSKEIPPSVLICPCTPLEMSLAKALVQREFSSTHLDHPGTHLALPNWTDPEFLESLSELVSYEFSKFTPPA